VAELTSRIDINCQPSHRRTVNISDPGTVALSSNTGNRGTDTDIATASGQVEPGLKT
jgi:hypothetical protein